MLMKEEIESLSEEGKLFKTGNLKTEIEMKNSLYVPNDRLELSKERVSKF